MNITGPANDKLERHLETLKGIRDTQKRREYIEAVERSEGKFSANWLKDEFANWWWSQQK